MVKNARMLEQFELELVRSSPPDFWQNLRIVEALYQEARHLGVLPRPDPLEGIEHKIQLANNSEDALRDY